MTRLVGALQKLRADETGLIPAAQAELSPPPGGLLTEFQLKVLKLRLVDGERTVLKPNATYTIVTAGHSATFKTNKEGQLLSVSFSLNPGSTKPTGTRLATSGDTRPIGQLGLKGDIGFHLEGDQFYGSNYYPNLVPGSSVLNKYNSGGFGQVEYAWATALGHDLAINNVKITLSYAVNNKLRPISFDLSFRIDKRPFVIRFDNNSSSN